MVIYEGKLKNTESFSVKKLSNIDIKDILELQRTVYAAISDKKKLSTLSREEFEHILKGHGLILGAYSGNELIAVRALLVPDINDPEHLGLDIGLRKEQLQDIIYQEISFVHPQHWGNRLQQKLATLIMEQLAYQPKQYRYICSTVAPFNIPSLKDKFYQGMRIKALKIKYDDQLRYIFFKSLVAARQNPIVKEKRTIPMASIKEQQKLLSAGWIGVSLEQNGDNFLINFEKHA